MLRLINKSTFRFASQVSSTSTSSGRFTRWRSSTSETPSKDDQALEPKAKEAQANRYPAKTVAEADAEMMRKLAVISGEGGEAGIEYEDGKAVAMKRGVKNNMFRLI